MFCNAKRAEIYLICVSFVPWHFLIDEYLSRNVESFNQGQEQTSGRIQFDSREFKIPQRGRQRQLQNLFLCFPAGKLTAKAYHKRLMR